MSQLSRIPSGTVTFLFTDIEGSTRRWEEQPQAMSAALARHDAILREAIEQNGGYVFKTVGDAFCTAFPTAHDALRAALAGQRGLNGGPASRVQGPESAQQDLGLGLRVRMALHTGATEERDGDYFGQPMNRVARLLSAGHGGQTLLSLGTYEMVRDTLPPGVTLLDLGEHRLKDLIRPEQVFQVVAPDLPGEFPPLKTLDNRPHNLPLQPTPMIGREKEVSAVIRLLQQEKVRLLTLTGPGGTGKTRLGLQVAAEMLDEYEDGAFFVNLAPLTDPGLVVSAIAQTLGVREAAGQPLLDTLQAGLKDKRLLLLLDNFEQVAPAALEVGKLLEAAPQIKLLVTSRLALRLRSEHEYLVPPLGLPDMKEKPSAERLTQYEAVRLFIERAQAVKTDFEISNDNAPAVAEICFRLDGLPLAIELAAARVKILPPQGMLSRLQSRLKLLTGGAKDLPARQQTLRNTIEWSYDLLDDEEKKLFSRLAVFVGGCTLEAAEAVCNGEGDLGMDVLDGVQSLVDKSLLKQAEGQGSEPRFTMLETIREYAADRLAESGEADTRKRHTDHFLQLAVVSAPDANLAIEAAWLDRLEEDLDNIRAALEYSQQQRWVEVAMEMAGSMEMFWERRGYWSEGRERLQRALSAPGASTATIGRARALQSAGGLARRQTDYSLARALHQEAFNISRQLGDKKLVGISMLGLGSVAYFRGDYTSAREYWQGSLPLFEEIGDRGLSANALTNLACALLSLDDLDGARLHFERSLSEYKQLGSVAGIAFTLENLGELAHRQGDYQAARAYWTESLAGFRELKDKSRIPVSLHYLGYLDCREGNYGEAEAKFKESLPITQEIEYKYGTAGCLLGLVGVALGRGQLQRAARLLGATDTLLTTIQTPFFTTDKIEHERIAFATRAGLAEVHFQNAWREGQAMSMEQAIAYALEGAEKPEAQG